MGTVDFATLWAHHPALRNPPLLEPCSNAGVGNYSNQCAIRLGVCLAEAGVSLSSFKGAVCWHRHGRSHPLRAEELANWLQSDSVRFVGMAEKSKRSAKGVQKTSVDYAGRSGIVLCRNFWGVGNQGDHIDLWDGSTLAHGGKDYFGLSQEIWFWALK